MTLVELPTKKLWSREEYQQLGTLELFEDGRVELIEGEIIVMAPQLDRHNAAMGLVRRALSKRFDEDRFWIRENGPMGFGKRSEPEPDVSVIPGGPRDIVGRGQPSQAEILVEVSETSLKFDRTGKATLYAFNSIADYWIVNLIDMQIEVHRSPNLQTGEYTDLKIFRRGESVAPLAAPGSPILVDDLLP